VKRAGKIDAGAPFRFISNMGHGSTLACSTTALRRTE
jgi:hypothetical protein